MKLKLSYGRSGLQCELPGERVMKVLRSRWPEPLRRPAAAVRNALGAPVGASPLAEAAKGAGSVCIVVSDVTRPVPYRVLLPPLLEALENEAGIPAGNISLLVATGLHRPCSPDELEEMLGKSTVRRYAVHNHDARDEAAHMEVGTTARGTRVQIDRRYMDADFRVTTALVEPHFMAGFSGGRKALCPGISSAGSIGRFHAARLLSMDGVETGRLEGNPVHAELLEAALMAGADFSVNVTLDGRRRLTGVFAGSLEAAHAAGCRACADSLRDALPAPVDVVLTTGSVYPLDATFYQAVKGIVAAAPVVKLGGTIIIAAECSEGMGGAEFTELAKRFGSPEVFLSRILAADDFVVDQWQLQMLCKALEKADVVLVSGGAADEAAEAVGIRTALSVETALAEALEKSGPDACAAVIPEGPYVIAACGM